MRIVRDHGDVLELSTAPVEDDCGAYFTSPYRLRVFVKRALLYARAQTAIVRSFPDGTAVAIDRGAAVVVDERGAHWYVPALAATPVTPGALTYAVESTAPNALPPATGTRMVCEGDTMTTLAEYVAAHGPVHDDDDVPYCGLAEEGATPPTVGGKPLPWLGDRDTSNTIVRSGASYLGDVEYACGRARVRVEHAGVAPGVGGWGMIGTVGRGAAGAPVTVWTPAKGPVTWPDGTPAGSYDGVMRYIDVVEIGDRICVAVDGVAERVCHRKQTATHTTS